jgi:arsenite methyltransferase
MSQHKKYVMEQSRRLQAKQLARRRGDYGFDAPYVPVIFGIIGIGCLIACLFTTSPLNIILLIYAIFMFLCMISYIYTTRWGKFQVWAKLLSQLELRDDEHLLDMGCGRGAVLLMAAKLLPNGHATGVDLWKTSDQSGNAATVTQHNAELEGVAGRVTLQTGDMQKLPFPDDSFDVVLSSLAIHNIHTADGRAQAIDEAVRVLKPGGKILIADIRQTQFYAQRLRELGMTGVMQLPLDPRFWYGGPWVATSLVRATKPSWVA